MSGHTFTVNEGIPYFKHGHTRFEQGNTYNQDNHPITDADLKMFWDAGWIEVEGWETAPPLSTSPVAIQPDNIVIPVAGGDV